MDELRLVGGTVKAPSFLHDDLIAGCKTYRDAVRLSWVHRRIKAMTLRTLAELTEAYPSHVSDYLHADDSAKRRNLPADRINAWASVTGNWAVQQWIARQAKLTFMEEVLAKRAA